jgi:hypothetical protein
MDDKVVPIPSEGGDAMRPIAEEFRSYNSCTFPYS